MLTFLPMDEVNRLSILEGSSINESKKIAAFEITKLIHGEEEALIAKKTSEELFESQNASENMPSVEIEKSSFNDETISVVDLLALTKIAPSKGQLEF